MVQSRQLFAVERGHLLHRIGGGVMGRYDAEFAAIRGRHIDFNARQPAAVIIPRRARINRDTRGANARIPAHPQGAEGRFDSGFAVRFLDAYMVG